MSVAISITGDNIITIVKWGYKLALELIDAVKSGTMTMDEAQNFMDNLPKPGTPFADFEAAEAAEASEDESE